jgi:hypothetical protein
MDGEFGAKHIGTIRLLASSMSLFDATDNIGSNFFRFNLHLFVAEDSLPRNSWPV